MKNLFTSFTEKTFLGQKESRFIFQNMERQFNRFKKVDQRTNKENLNAFDLEDYNKEIKNVEGLKKGFYGALGNHKSSLTESLSIYDENQDELARAKSDKNRRKTRKDRRTTRKNLRLDKDEFKESENLLQEALDKAKKEIDPIYSDLEHGHQNALYRLERLRQEKSEKKKLFELAREIDSTNQKMLSQKNKDSFLTGNKAVLEDLKVAIKAERDIDKGIKNAEAIVSEYQDAINEFHAFHSILKSQKDAYKREKFKPTKADMVERRKLLSLLKSNKALTNISEIRAFTNDDFSYKAEEKVKGVMIQLIEDSGITNLREDASRVNQKIIDHKNKKYHNEEWQNQLKTLETERDEIQKKIDNKLNSSSEDYKSSDKLVSEAVKEFENAQKDFENAQVAALKQIKEDIKTKENQYNNSSEGIIDIPKLEKEIEELKAQKINLKNGEDINNVPQGKIFEDLKDKFSTLKTAEVYLEKLQESLDREGIEYSGGYYSLNSSENYSCAVDIDPVAKSRIERKINKEIEAKFKQDFEQLENLSTQYGQLKVKVAELQTRYDMVRALPETYTDSEVKAVEKSLTNEMKNLENKEQEIKDKITAIEAKKSTSIKGLMDEVFRLKMEKADLDPKASDFQKNKANKNLAEAQAEQELMKKMLEDRIDTVSQGLPKNREKLKYEYSLEKALEELNRKGNYEALKNANRSLNLIKYDIKDARNSQEKNKFLKESLQYKQERITAINGLKKDIQEVIQGLRDQKNTLEKDHQTALDADDANTESGKLRIEIAKEKLDEMTARMTFIEQGLCKKFYDLTHQQLKVSGYMVDPKECGCTVYSDPELFDQLVVDSQKVILDRSAPDSPTRIETPSYMPEGIGTRIVENSQWCQYPTAVQKLVAENRNMVTPVKETQSGVSLEKYGNVIEVVPVDLKAVPPKEYSPRYYQVQENGNLRFITEFKVANGEKLGFRMGYTPKEMQETLNRIDVVLENKADYDAGIEHIETLKKEYPSVVKRFITSPKLRMVFSPSNNPRSELYKQEYIMEYDPVQKKWKLDMSGLSDVEKKELKSEGLNEKPIPRGKFTDILHNFSKKIREPQVEKSPSIGTSLSNWWTRLSWSPGTWFDFS